MMIRPYSFVAPGLAPATAASRLATQDYDKTTIGGVKNNRNKMSLLYLL